MDTTPDSFPVTRGQLEYASRIIGHALDEMLRSGGSPTHERLKRSDNLVYEKLQASDNLTLAAVTLARATIRVAAEQYPADTSCLSCDSHRDGFCLKWKQLIPKEHLSTGCAERQEHGAPF